MPEADMVDDTPVDVHSPDPATRAGALIERAIAQIQAGEHDAALADLAEAESVAQAEGLHEIVTAARINQGYAFSIEGENEAAARLYGEAADLAREAGDTIRLPLALANMSVELEVLGKHAEVVSALDEYVALLEEGQTEAQVRALITRGTSRMELGDTSGALADLQEAEGVATESDDAGLMYIALMSLGRAYGRDEDPHSALMLFDRASMLARQLESDEHLRDALLALAETNHAVGHDYMARLQFAEVEKLCRQTENPELLAHALYWFGGTLQALGKNPEAIQKWSEAGDIRRELGQEGHLADCLVMMADAYRRRSQHEKADPLFAEATEIYARIGLGDVVGSTVYWHGMSLWSGGNPAEALERADEALRLAIEDGNSEYECRAHGLRAMVLADLDRLDEALVELDVAETRCEESGLHNLVVWMLARRAYLKARQDGEPDEVTRELSRAYSYAVEHDQTDAATSAIKRVSSLIISRCDERYREPVKALKEALLSTPVGSETADGISDVPFVAPAAGPAAESPDAPAEAGSPKPADESPQGSPAE
jgi:tetratricopeptide (TPR) repeat protein